MKLYVNFTESFFVGNTCGIKEATSIECANDRQATELYNNALSRNRRAKAERRQVPYKYVKIALNPRKNARLFTYEEYTVLHDDYQY